MVIFFLPSSGCSSTPSAKPPTGLRPSLPLTVSSIVIVVFVFVVVFSICCFSLLFLLLLVVVLLVVLLHVMVEALGCLFQLHPLFPLKLKHSTYVHS